MSHVHNVTLSINKPCHVLLAGRSNDGPPADDLSTLTLNPPLEPPQETPQNCEDCQPSDSTTDNANNSSNAVHLESDLRFTQADIEDALLNAELEHQLYRQHVQRDTDLLKQEMHQAFNEKTAQMVSTRISSI